MEVPILLQGLNPTPYPYGISTASLIPISSTRKHRAPRFPPLSSSAPPSLAGLGDRKEQSLHHHHRTRCLTDYYISPSAQIHIPRSVQQTHSAKECYIIQPRSAYLQYRPPSPAMRVVDRLPQYNLPNRTNRRSSSIPTPVCTTTTTTATTTPTGKAFKRRRRSVASSISPDIHPHRLSWSMSCGTDDDVYDEDEEFGQDYTESDHAPHSDVHLDSTQQQKQQQHTMHHSSGLERVDAEPHSREETIVKTMLLSSSMSVPQSTAPTTTTTFVAATATTTTTTTTPVSGRGRQNTIARFTFSNSLLSKLKTRVFLPAGHYPFTPSLGLAHGPVSGHCQNVSPCTMPHEDDVHVRSSWPVRPETMTTSIMPEKSPSKIEGDGVAISSNRSLMGRRKNELHSQINPALVQSSNMPAPHHPVHHQQQQQKLQKQQDMTMQHKPQQKRQVEKDKEQAHLQDGPSLVSPSIPANSLATSSSLPGTSDEQSSHLTALSGSNTSISAIPPTVPKPATTAGPDPAAETDAAPSAGVDRSPSLTSRVSSSSSVSTIHTGNLVTVRLSGSVRSRKYSLNSRHNSVAPEDTHNNYSVCNNINNNNHNIDTTTPKTNLHDNNNTPTSDQTMLLAPSAVAVNGTPRVHHGLTSSHVPQVILIDELSPSSTRTVVQDPVAEFESILARRHSTSDEIAASLHRLRQLVLYYGVPEDNTTTIAQSTTTPQPGKPSFRARIWKLLLEVHHVSAQEYISLVKMGKPEENGTYNKIRNDTFRTMATDKRFLDVVDEDRLIRVLCAFAWKMHAPGQNGESFSYVQGMNVLAAPFLYAMSEMDAFYSFSNFIQFCCPLYVQPALQGVHCGIKLLEECLRAIDLELYESLRAKRLSAELYAFPSVLTLCACTPPLDQAMQLWDFLLAWGLHLNIICIIAQMILIRQDLLEHASPMKLLRIFPDLDAPKIIAKTMEIIRLVPDPLYDMLVRHPYDKSVAVEVEAYAQGGSA